MVATGGKGAHLQELLTVNIFKTEHGQSFRYRICARAWKTESQHYHRPRGPFCRRRRHGELVALGVQCCDDIKRLKNEEEQIIEVQAFKIPRAKNRRQADNVYLEDREPPCRESLV